MAVIQAEPKVVITQIFLFPHHLPCFSGVQIPSGCFTGSGGICFWVVLVNGEHCGRLGNGKEEKKKKWAFNWRLKGCLGQHLCHSPIPLCGSLLWTGPHWFCLRSSDLAPGIFCPSISASYGSCRTKFWVNPLAPYWALRSSITHTTNPYVHFSLF